jgi:hypothetical protein
MHITGFGAVIAEAIQTPMSERNDNTSFSVVLLPAPLAQFPRRLVSILNSEPDGYWYICCVPGRRPPLKKVACVVGQRLRVNRHPHSGGHVFYR